MRPRISGRAFLALALYLAIYTLATLCLQATPEVRTDAPLAVALVLSAVLAACAWLATLGIQPAVVTVRQPARETGAVLAYLALFAVLVLGWGLSALDAALPDGPMQDTAILLLKLATMVAVPGWLLGRMGYTWRELIGLRTFDRRLWRVFLYMALLLLGLQLLLGQGVRDVASLEQPPWITALYALPALAWISVEAGFTEEFLFRAVLQTRAAAWLRSETAGILFMSVLFALAHAPGLVLRGAHAAEGMTVTPGMLVAAAYVIVIASPAGLLFGVLWARTRNLLLLTLLHGGFDLIPNLAPFIRTWGGS